MKKLLFIAIIITTLISSKAIAQPFADVVNFSTQTFSSPYKDTARWKNKTDSYYLNLFFPKEFKNGNVLLIRINSELMNATFKPDSSYSSKLAYVSVPLGFQFLSKNKKWKTVTMVIPKIASDFKGTVNDKDFQLGGIVLENYIVNEKLKIKAGLYYNREAFGDFYMPLVGVDWAATGRINFYGILPTNYKVEFNLVRNKLYTGLNFKSFTRSFRLSQQENYDYVRYNEIQLKLFVDYFIYKKLLLFGEVGYSIGKSPLLYKYNTKDEVFYNPIYMPLKPYPAFNVGIAYRIRTDLMKE